MRREARHPHPSHPFNPLLASAFFRAGYVESWGRGIEKMRRECASHDAPAPIFDTSMSGLMLTFKANPAHLIAAVGEKAARALLNSAGEVAGEVTGEVKRLVLVCRDSMSRKSLQDALALKGEENFRTLYLVPALKADLIEMTIPDKPSSSQQKYRLTAEGRKLQATLLKAGKA